MKEQIKLFFSPEDQGKAYSIQRFEELMGIKYLSHLECSDWKIERWVRKKCAAAFVQGRITQTALWLGQLHHQALEQAIIPNISIRWINPKIGYGVFSEHPFPAWTYIGEYTGILRTRPRFFPNLNGYCFMYPKEWLSWKALTIDSEKQGNFTRFINHSDTPNLESLSVFHKGIFHVIFRTICPIPSNTQLTYDYGDLYWLKRKKSTNLS